MKSFNYTVLAVALFGLAGVAQAATSSGQSYDTAIVVDGTQGAGTPNHPSANGIPAVGVKAFHNGAKVAFSGLKGMVPTDTHGVTTITAAMMPPSHSALGNFDFKQVASQQVYYGEWSQSGANNDPTRTVYYSGDTTGRVLPTASVTYAVQGINNYSGGNLMSGELTASFGTAAPKLTGSLNNSTLKVALDANINTATASFSGDAVARNTTTNALLSNGTTQGSFFGAGATASVAGIAKFANRNYDTAFGGARK